MLQFVCMWEICAFECERTMWCNVWLVVYTGVSGGSSDTYWERPANGVTSTKRLSGALLLSINVAAICTTCGAHDT